MKTFDDIEALWKATPTAVLPDAAEIIKKASNQKRLLGKRILKQVFFLMAALLSMLIVMCVIHFRYASSYIGLALMMICIVVFSMVRFRQSQFLKRVDFSQSPSILLMQFEKFYRHQKWVNVQGTVIYTVVLNIAFAFYFYEILIVTNIDMAWKVGLLAVYMAWMTIATMWLERKCMSKEHARTADIIEKIKQLQNTG